MMRYSEIPHDFSSDSLHFAEFGEEQIYRNLRDDSPPSDVSIQSGPGHPLMGSEKKKLTLKSSGTATVDYVADMMVREPRTKKNSLSGTSGAVTLASTPSEQYVGLNTTSKKSNSLPPNASIHDYDSMMISALRISPEDLANQITLLDFPVFATIQPDELTSCAWTKKNKHIVTPNIVAFTKRFNHTSFWTVQEILSGSTPKYRAEILGHFIRVAKKLYELNNLHSLFSIVSALQSASIYRLEKTWSCLSKKDRNLFDRLADIFNDRDNFRVLREYLESLKLPCIPYIGLFLTDLVYIDLAFPHKSGGIEPEQRTIQMNNILRVISNYQHSDYTFIVPVPQTQKYLQSVRYIEELQNIFEEDQYKKSVKLEPLHKPCSNSAIPPSSSSCSSKESIVPIINGNNVDSIAIASLNLSPAKSVTAMRSASSVSGASKFIPGHRKCRSLGTKRSTSLPRNFHQKCVCPVSTTRTLPVNCKCRIFKTNAQVGVMNGNGMIMPGGGYGAAIGLGGGGGGVAGGNFLVSAAATDSNESMTQHSRHLLDDSVLEDKHPGDSISTGSSEGVFGVDGLEEKNQKGRDVLEFQGCVRRKTMLKDGRKPAVASWQRYWLQIWANSLVYFPPKTFKGNERTDFKREPCKVCSLDGWHVEQLDNIQHANTFQLVNLNTNTVYKFRTSSPKLASLWVDILHQIINSQHVETLPVNLMSFE